MAKRVDPGISWNTISVLLTDNAGIQEVNRTYLGRDNPTDVISFRYESDTDKQVIDGELIINVECAVEVGDKHGGVYRELALYLAHGCDHLLDEDDYTAPERKRMRNRELRWLAKAGDMIHRIAG